MFGLLAFSSFALLLTYGACSLYNRGVEDTISELEESGNERREEIREEAGNLSDADIRRKEGVRTACERYAENRTKKNKKKCVDAMKKLGEGI